MPYYTPSNEMEAITVRPASTSIFGIDSDDRYKSFADRRTNPTYPFRFNIQKNEAFLNGFFKRIALTEFRMNWTLPNISLAWGNSQMMMSYKIGTGALTTVTLTIPDGFYGAEELAAALQTTMRGNGLPQAVVTIGTGGTDTTPDEWYWIRSGASNTQFYFNPMPNNPYRQLIDMLNISAPTGTTLQNSMFTGIPTLRATDYIDVVCSQLTQNQNLRDSSTSSASRDMLCRVYLDESTPSRSTSVTNNYSGVNGNVSLVAGITSATVSGNIVTYTLNSSAGTYPIGSYCVISGITGSGTSLNGSGRILATTTSSPFTATVELPFQAALGTPSYTSAVITLYDKIETVSIPQTTWDDNVNGVTPFVLYRQYQTPKYIRWSGHMPIANMQFELFDDMGRSIQDLWSIYTPVSPEGFNFANSFSWNATLLTSED